jgi:hypothetical protein
LNPYVDYDGTLQPEGGRASAAYAEGLDQMIFRFTAFSTTSPECRLRTLGARSCDLSSAQP